MSAKAKMSGIGLFRHALSILLLTISSACGTDAAPEFAAPAPMEVNGTHGAYSLAIDALSWAQQAQLLASDGAASDYFGISVSISGDTAIVGAYRDNVGMNTDQGSAYVFVRNGGTWTQEAQLVASDGAALDYFGASVSISGDTAVIGAWADDVGATQDQGSAYVFVRNGTIWTQQAKLSAADGAVSDLFGYSVAISGDTVLVGARYDDVTGNMNQGSAYVFVRNGTMWTQEAQLVANDGSASDEFGWSVSLSADTAVVGAHYDDVAANADQGSAYVFVRNGTAWTQQAQLVASDGAASDYFGHSVSVSGDTVVAGAHFHDIGANTEQGAAYVFVRNGAMWTQQAQLLANGGETSDAFGMSVAVLGDTAVVGAWYDDVGANMNQGSGYVFQRNGTTWTQDAQLVASDGETGDLFGSSASLSGNTVILGAHFDLVAGNTSRGSASVFVVGAPKVNGESCGGAGECQSGFCVDGVCCNAACGADAAGDCQACSMAAGAPTNGTCAVANAGMVCRSALGACDIAEMCDGMSSVCPMDAKVNAGQVCRSAKGLCDEFEFCDGMASDCPPDAKTAAGVFCRSPKGLCDEPEACDGTSDTCPTDKLTAIGIVCRAANGVCDVPEVCTGANAQCPSDGLVASGTECRASLGACDTAETCDGATNDCPSDTKAAAGTECRTSAGACDSAESCDGATNDCPIDEKSPNGTACNGGTCNNGVCVEDGGSGGMGAGGSGNAGMGGMGGTGGDVFNGGSAGNGSEPTDPGGCGCRVVASSDATSAAWPLLGLAWAAWRRRLRNETRA